MSELEGSGVLVRYFIMLKPSSFSILISFQLVCLSKKMSFLKFWHRWYIRDLMNVLSSPEFAE